VETLDRAIGIWQQVAPRLFKTALETPPEVCPMCLRQADLIRVPIPGNGILQVPCVCHTARHARVIYQDCLKANKMDIQDEQKTMKNMDRYGTPEQWQTLKDAASSLHSLIQSPLQHRWITIIGAKGCGKSHIVLSARNAMKQYAVYFYAASLGDEIFDSLDHDSTVALKDRLIRAPVLLLDDLGTEPARSDFVNQFINSVIGERYQRGIYAPTVITTNLLEADLDRRYDRLADRILDENLVNLHHITLPTYRRRKRKGA
jgi:DNA replication protein DnaC